MKAVPIAIAALAWVASGSFGCGPVVDAPIVGAFQGDKVEIKGAGFGLPGAGSHLVLKSGATTVQLPSTAPQVQVWEDERIVLALEDDAPTGWVRVVTPLGTSRAVRVEVYRYEWFDIPATPGTNAYPLAIETDSAGRVWVNQEFHLEFQLLDPAVGSVVGLPIPKPPNPGPFASTLFWDHRTQMSSLGEDVLVDPYGRIWLSQGGGYLYSGAYPNHSRVVSYDPGAAPGSEYRVYNVPGDWNEIIGLAWDPEREWIWFTQGGLVSGARILGFDPELVPWDNHFDFATSLDHLLCFPGAPDDACYHAYDLPNPTAQPAHLAFDPDGGLWYTAFWGRAIGRLDPETGSIVEFPLPEPISLADPASIVGSGPWEIAFGPDGDLYFCEFFDATLARFDMERVGDPACLQLDALGKNPCIEERVIPEADPKDEQVHSIAFDPDGDLWFTIHAPDEPDTLASLGFVSARFHFAVRLPPLSIFPSPRGAASAGVAVDPETGDVWFAEFWRHRIGRLRPIGEL